MFFCIFQKNFIYLQIGKAINMSTRQLEIEGLIKRHSIKDKVFVKCTIDKIKSSLILHSLPR